MTYQEFGNNVKTMVTRKQPRSAIRLYLDCFIDKLSKLISKAKRYVLGQDR